MPTPKHAVASAIGVELPQFSSFLCCLEQPPKRLVSLDFGYATNKAGVCFPFKKAVELNLSQAPTH